MAIFFDSIAANSRRDTVTVNIGTLQLGSNHQLVPQSMATTPTTDIEGAVEDAIDIIKAGGKLVRYTASSVAEANALALIKSRLRDMGYNAPLVADVHFNPQAAFVAASIVEKVRINPGNFASLPRNTQVEFSDEEYKAEQEVVEVKLIELLEICKKNKTALRIGVNHGSLSARIMSRYGDSVEGMCHSAMEYLRVCEKEQFKDVVVSMKSSNVAIMVRAYRAITEAMYREGMKFAIHLGVTEAGEGEDGRIRSAVGIGTLLNDGIGDTLRVSLTESPAAEIDVAQKLIEYIASRGDKYVNYSDNSTLEYNPLGYFKRKSSNSGVIGGANPPRVIFERVNDLGQDLTSIDTPHIELNLDTLQSNLSKLRNESKSVIVFHSDSPLYAIEARLFVLTLEREKITNPVIAKRCYNSSSLNEFIVQCSVDMGPLFVDGLIDGIWIDDSSSNITPKTIVDTAFSILQSSRARFTKTEFISCPGCGRTQFNLQESVRRVKKRCAHFTGLKIAVMGCIVNGPGEMADADYGYVGAGKAKVNLYKGKEVVVKGIPEEQAVEKLVELIEQNINNG